MGISSVRLSYDASRFGGPEVAPGWKPVGAPGNYISSGNVTPITGLELDQGRLTARGTPEDSDDPGNYRPRSLTPSLDAARAFAGFLRKDGITVARQAVGRPGRGTAPGSGSVLAAVHSPALAAIVQQMLSESNNVIAETLARQVAVATGRPGTFAGAAAAVMAVDARLKVSGLHLYDGSGLSPLDRISPQALVRLVGLAATIRAAQPAVGDHRAAGGRLLRDAGSRQLLRAVRPERARHGPGQDRQPDPRGDDGGSRLYRRRPAARVRVHGQ